MAEGDTRDLSAREAKDLSAREANLLAEFVAIRSEDAECEIMNSLKEIVADQSSDFIERFCKECKVYAGRQGTPFPLRVHLETLSSMVEASRVKQDQASRVKQDQASRVELSTFLSLADIRPNLERGLETGDAPFMRIMSTIRKSGPVTAHKLVQDDLGQLVAIRKYFPDFLPPLVQLARGEDWTGQMKAVEDHFDPAGASGADGPKLDPAADDLLAAIARAPETTMHPLTLLRSDPRLSTMLPDEIIAFDQLGSIAIQDQVEDFTPIANEILRGNLLGEHGERFDEDETIRALLELRIRIAERFRRFRLTAKFDVLESRWPGLIRMLQTDLAQVKRLEKFLLGDQGGEPLPDGDTAELWNECQQDMDLKKLFRMRPHFDELTLKELERYLKVSQLVTQTAEPGIGQPQLVSPVLALVIPDYKPLQISITKKDEKGHYSVSLWEPLPGQPQDIQKTENEVQIDWAVINPQIATLGWVRQDSPAMISTRDLGPAPEMEPTLKEIGKHLYDWFFQGNVKERFEALITSAGEYRVHLELKDSELPRIPWESLFPATHETAIALTTHYSLVRYYPPSRQLPPKSFTPPLRILVVLPMPVDVPRINSEQEASILQRTLAADVQGGWVQLKFLRNEEARIEEFQRALRRFNPHVFHFMGHGYYDNSTQKGYLVFQKDQKKAPCDPETMAILLRDSNVGVAILNGCDTGTSYTNDALGGVARALVTAGVPAVIATMRQVLDEAALIFTREFYRSFVDGSPVEVAVVEARKALQNQQLNWSAYALFSGRKPHGKPEEDLKRLRLVRGALSRRSAGPAA